MKNWKYFRFGNDNQLSLSTEILQSNLSTNLGIHIGVSEIFLVDCMSKWWFHITKWQQSKQEEESSMNETFYS